MRASPIVIAMPKIANKIALGQIESGIAGGTDTTSDAPVAISDKLRKKLMKVNAARDTAGKLNELWTVPKGEDGKEKAGDLNWVHCIALDSQGNIFAGDIRGKRIQKFVRKAGGRGDR